MNVNRAVKKQNITERPSRAKCSFKLIAIKSKDKLNWLKVPHVLASRTLYNICKVIKIENKRVVTFVLSWFLFEKTQKPTCANEIMNIEKIFVIKKYCSIMNF